MKKLAKIKRKINKAVRKGKKMLTEKGSVMQEYMQKQKKNGEIHVKESPKERREKIVSRYT